MKVFIIYDDNGLIKSIGAPHSEHADRIGVHPPPGHKLMVTDLTDVEHPHHLEKYRREFQIDSSSGKATLRKK
jgi:hypothetical protein